MTRAPCAAVRLRQLLDNRFEQHRRNGQVMGGPLRPAEFFAERLEGGGIVVIAVHVTQQAAQLLERRWIDSAVLFEAVAEPCARS